MAKKSTPARARKLDEQVPLRATKMGVGQQEMQAQLKTIGNQKDRGKAELKDLQAQLKANHGSAGGKGRAARAAQDRVGLTLEKIRSKFGEDEFQRAVKEFNLSFQGITKINLLRNKGPGIDNSIQ